MKKPLVIVLVCLGVSACSVRMMAVDMLGDALTDGAGVYTSDNDPQLIREAIPFGLKTYEGLLNVSPDHRELLLATANGFVAYAYFLQEEADAIDEFDFAAAERLRSRSSNLFLRSRDYALRGLELEHAEFTDGLRSDSAATLAETTQEDVPFLYLAGLAWAAAFSTSNADLVLVAELPFAVALMARVLELDETYQAGAAHEFFISYEGVHPGGSADEARKHYQRALKLSQGKRASLHLALAEAVTIREQNLEEFRSLIAATLAVNSDEVPEFRLINTIARQRAERLETQIPKLFVIAE